MPGIRETLNQKPWIGWAVAGVLLVVAGWFAFRSMTVGGDRFNPDSMRETVTIKYTDTGDTEEVHRGRLIKRLLDECGGKPDPTRGLINPKTGQPTGFLFDKEEWDAMIADLTVNIPAKSAAGAPSKAAPPKPSGGS
jgi:hypothetical protein